MKVNYATFLAIALLSSAFAVGSTTPVSASDLCSQLGSYRDGCPGSVTTRVGDGVVDLRGSQTSPGSGGSNSSGDGQASNNDSDDAAPPVPTGSVAYPDPLSAHCQSTAPCPTDPLDEAPATAPVTIDDLASFAPSPAAAVAEPNGWAVLGLPTNFYLDAESQVVSGSLLGQAADVRFTPVASTWNYGDGTIRTVDGTGDAWEWLGQREFTETSTSHTYTVRADYTVTAAVVLAAEYRFAGSAWLPVVGTLSVPAPPLTLTAWHVKTVLVSNP